MAILLITLTSGLYAKGVDKVPPKQFQGLWAVAKVTWQKRDKHEPNADKITEEKTTVEDADRRILGPAELAVDPGQKWFGSHGRDGTRSRMPVARGFDETFRPLDRHGFRPVSVALHGAAHDGRIGSGKEISDRIRVRTRSDDDRQRT